MKFEEILTDNDIEYRTTGQHEHARPGWIQIDCPHCSPGWKRFYMGYNTRGNYVNCYYCGRHGLAETVSALIDISYRKASLLIKDFEGDFKFEKPQRTKLVLPTGLKDLGELPALCMYLKERGFDWKELRRLWELRGIGLSARLAWRVFVPIILNGDVVSWTTRSISKRKAGRYVAASPAEESIDHKTLLYGEDYCRESVICVEGPTDVWRVGPGAVCTFGTGYSRGQVERLSRYPVRVVCYDSEEVAQRTSRELTDQLSVFPGATYNVVLDAADPGEASKKEIKQLRKHFLGDSGW